MKKFSYEALLAGLGTLAKNGLTSFVDARNFYRRGNHEAFQVPYFYVFLIHQKIIDTIYNYSNRGNTINVTVGFNFVGGYFLVSALSYDPSLRQTCDLRN